MRITKFEAAGLGLSVAAMALALFLLRVDMTLNDDLDAVAEESADPVMVVNGESQQAALATALENASPDGKLERMIINDVILGTGAVVEEGSTVEVHYIGTLQNGQQFDNSYQKGQSFTFTIGDGKVIPGWEQGLIDMKVGGQRILVIPPELAYGRDGFGPIPRNATLVFAIELLSIK